MITPIFSLNILLLDRGFKVYYFITNAIMLYNNIKPISGNKCAQNNPIATICATSLFGVVCACTKRHYLCVFWSGLWQNTMFQSTFNTWCIWMYCLFTFQRSSSKIFMIHTNLGTFWPPILDVLYFSYVKMPINQLLNARTFINWSFYCPFRIFDRYRRLVTCSLALILYL